MDVKPDSLEWTCTQNHHFADRGEITVEHVVGPVTFNFKPEGLNILGVMLDTSNQNHVRWKHRIREAQQTWMSLKEQLCRRRVPLRERVLRWQATVGKTLLWGCGCWTMTKHEFMQIQAFQLRCFRYMWGRRAKPDEQWSQFCIRLTHQIKITLQKWNVELVADTALQMYHSWAVYAARLSSDYFLHDLIRYRSVADTGLRKVWGRPKDWNCRLQDHHGLKWWRLSADRDTWKRCGKDFVKDRCETFGLPEPSARGTNSGPTWRAGFFEVLGNPILGSFCDRHLTMIGTRERTVQLVLGRGTPSQANRTIVKRLPQGHYLITEVQQFSCRGADSCFMIIKNSKMMRLLTEAAARTGIDMKQICCICPRAGDMVMASWDYTRICGQSAAARAIFVAFPEGGNELVCWQSRKVECEEDEEGDLTAVPRYAVALTGDQSSICQMAHGVLTLLWMVKCQKT